MIPKSLMQEIARLSNEQIDELALFMQTIRGKAQQPSEVTQFWQRATPAERAEDFRMWATQLPETGISLSDEACDRGSIYEE